MQGKGASSQTSGCTGRQDVHLLAGLEQDFGLRKGKGPILLLSPSPATSEEQRPALAQGP